MKEKFLSLLKPQVDPNVKISVVSLFIAKVLESIEKRIVSLEARQLQKGDKGDKGEKGDRGEKGKDGIQGVQGKQGLNGINGKDGKDGKDGKTGKQGVGVVDAEIAADDHLVLKLSNGSIIDAGELPTATSNSSPSVFVSGNSWLESWGNAWGVMTPSVGPTLKYWTGAAWEAKTLKRWNGSSWVTSTLNYFNGSSWA